ncbi:hypothetical protein J6590_103859 [Homalodisca vitripennis]|nr:hypothetical protein J6590_103859 [Homalodisca vitripennis]
MWRIFKPLPEKDYSLSEYVTVDEMLEAFCGRCSFRRYIPDKAARYETKVVLLISTFHHIDAIDEDFGDKEKPVMLPCYNKYKGGLDTV